MARLLVLALVSKACLGQRFLQGQNAWSQPSSGNYQGNPYPNNGIIQQSGQCPVMSEIGSATKLQISPWAWFRTVNIVQTNNMMSDASGGSSTSVGVVQPIAPTRTGASDSTLLADTAEYQALAQVRSTLGLTPTMALYDPHTGREISRIVNGHFWETKQEIFDCNGQLLGKVRYQPTFQNFFTNDYVEREVENAQGNHIANLIQETMTESHFTSGQHFIYIADLNGNAMASMRHPLGGWQVGPFGEYFECDLQMQTMNAQVSPPAMNPEFLSLVLANAMAGEHLLGPYISLIFYPLFIVLIFFCCAFCGIGCDHVRYWLTCCGLCGCCGLCASNSSAVDNAKATSQHYQDSANQEKDSLLASAKNATGQGGSQWNCCSRRAPTLVAPSNTHH